ncbi:hypothetical protein JCM5296_004558 [Sporobolomyces johnsonii]
MLSAATNRFSRAPSPTPSNSLSPAPDRSNRRLSRLSPSQFDDMVATADTVRATTGRDESMLGASIRGSPTANPDSFASPSSPDPASRRSPIPPLLAPEPSTPDNIKRRSMFRSVGNASSPDLASLVRKAREASGRPSGDSERVEPLGEGATGAARDAAAIAYYDAESDTDGEYSTPLPHPPRNTASSDPFSAVRTSPPRTRSTTSPATTRTHRPSTPPSHNFTQLSVPSDPSSRDSTVAERPSTGKLSSISTFSSGSYVDVPFPTVEDSPKSSTTTRPGPNASTTSLGLGFDFSPRRRRALTGEGDDGKISLSSTMRKTSRFFRKFGGGGSSNTTKQAASTPTTPASSNFTFSQAPPVPPIPATFSHDAPPKSRPSTGGHDSSGRNSSVDINIHSPQRPSPVKLPSSYAVARDESNTSLISTQSSSSSARRRSMSLSSMPAAALLSVDPAVNAGRDRRPAGKTEDDQLRKELRQWRLGVDGVLGAVGEGVSAGTSALNGSPSKASQSSPQLGRALSAEETGSARRRGVSPTPPAVRRPSLPEGTEKDRALPAAGPRSASVQSSNPEPRRNAGRSEPAADTPSIRLVSPSHTTSNPSSTDSSPLTTPRGLPTKRHSVAVPENHAISAGLATITEGSHSRESSAATPPIKSAAFTSPRKTASSPSPATPTLVQNSPLLGTPSSSPGASTNHSTPTAPPIPTLAPHRAKGYRQSIVGYPSRPGSGPASASTSTSSVQSGSSHYPPVVRRPKTAEETAGRGQGAEAMGEEEAWDEKASAFAKRCWDEDETFLERRKIAEWLGSSNPLNAATLRRYIDMFDFGGIRLDMAFRRLCGKLYLKAETQQVDRILEQFSRRYFEDNPRSPYSSADVVHAVSYSLLLLNTDLHVVDSGTRMTRQQFIRNTISAIQAQTGEDEPDHESSVNPSLLFGANAPEDGNDSTSIFGPMGAEASASRKSLDRPKTSGSKAPSVYSSTSVKDSPASSTPNLTGSPVLTRTAAGTDSPARGGPHRSESLATVSSAHSSKSLEANLQATLKDMYNAIRSQPIYQSSSSTLNLPEGRPSLSGNSPYATWAGGVNRSSSRRSAASNGSGGGSAAYKRASVRGMGGFLGASSSLELARSSSPTPSTTTSLSDDQWTTAFAVASSSHHASTTIGFANSLTHTIIREQQEDDAKSDSSISVTDEELALLGAPWAKEGILQRKHYWETPGKRAKDKNWAQAFVVVSGGELKMFKFDGSGGGMRMAGRGGLGGGDWTSNASSVGAISLIHALCSAMPPPGYSQGRPHCFVLTLPSGGSYFFQAGTADLVAEWVATCNYWSARLSKEPLSGGVSNMEYGWNRVDKLAAGDDDAEEVASVRSGKSGHSRMSYAASTFQGGAAANSSDRMAINEWKPPNVPLTASTLSEEAQLDHLRRHVGIVQGELAHHNTLRAPMIKLYSSRSSNASRALANWERKSQHLLTEIVKWRTYIEALSNAVRLRSIQRGRKEVEAMLQSADVDEDDDDELAASLSPFEMPPASMSVPGTDTDDTTRPGYPSVSRVSITTTTTNGDEYFDSSDTTPPAVGPA